MTKDEAFIQFWKLYPRKVAKEHARKMFNRALDRVLKEMALDAFMAKVEEAIAAYIRHKPDRIDFKHPATWISGGCWDDEWQSVPAALPDGRERRATMSDLAKDLFSGANHERLIN